jgi:hypothetical protein
MHASSGYSFKFALQCGKSTSHTAGKEIIFVSNILKSVPDLEGHIAYFDFFTSQNLFLMVHSNSSSSSQNSSVV